MKYTFEDLLEIMKKLRSEDGCPWDREQTHQSIKKHIVEEAYEVVEAIDSGIPERIADESGDMLLQVIFHAQIGSEDGTYTIDDVTDAICKKLIHRHPHIFGDSKAVDWDEIKRLDRNQSTITDELKGISSYLPALMRAEKIQKKAEKAGFSLNQDLGIDSCELELGQAIFGIVEQCRENSIDPELALNKYLRHFIEEFDIFEQRRTNNEIR